MDLPGLQEPVEVVFDQRAVPHIFAESLKDACYVQGYLVARDRLWQMDISTRATAGRLAEVLGENALPRDRRQRRKGILLAAERSLAAWKASTEEMALLEAYTDGANAYINSLLPSQYPLEFKLLGYEPEPWTPLKTVLFFKSMEETLCARADDLGTTNARQFLGDSLFQWLYPEYNPKQSPVIPTSVEWAFEPQPVEGGREELPASPPMMSTLIPHEPLPQPPPFVGSNNWAVAGSKTASGKPILCNDPHLRLSLPSIWYELQIHTPELNAYGVALPGVPGLIIGFNENTAWGVTNVGHDVLDWYRIDWADEAKETYQYGDGTKAVRKVVEVIQVRGRREPVRDTVLYTEWGPVVHQDPEHPYHDMAMHWLASEEISPRPFYELGTFLRLAKSKGLKDYREALQGYHSPAQNFAFASREGDIALRVNGRLPLRERQEGRFVQDGSRPEADWNGFIPFEHLPRVVNPQRGFISSANQHSTGQDYPYYYHGSFDDYRGRYLNRRLNAMDDIELEDMQALQLDNYSIKAEEAAPLLLGLLDSTGADSLRNHPAVENLRRWDYRFEAEAKAPVLFEEWLSAAYRLTFDELLALSDSVSVQMPQTWRFLALLEESPGHRLFDVQKTAALETAREVVSQALSVALENYESQSWRTYLRPRIGHLGRIKAFMRDSLPTGGYRDALNAISGPKGPSWRMVVQLGESPEAYGVYPGGASGNPGSPYYDLMVDDWAAGRYHPLHLMSRPEDKSVEPIYTWKLKPEAE